MTRPIDQRAFYSNSSPVSPRSRLRTSDAQYSPLVDRLRGLPMTHHCSRGLQKQSAEECRWGMVREQWVSSRGWRCRPKLVRGLPSSSQEEYVDTPVDTVRPRYRRNLTSRALPQAPAGRYPAPSKPQDDLVPYLTQQILTSFAVQSRSLWRPQCAPPLRSFRVVWRGFGSPVAT
jgi:hypothetical protein